MPPSNGILALSPTDHSIAAESSGIRLLNEKSPRPQEVVDSCQPLALVVAAIVRPYCCAWILTSQFAGSGRIANVGSLPRTIATSSH